MTRLTAWARPIGAAALCAAFVAATGCDEEAGAPTEPVKISGEWFHLEVAADDATRMQGLGGRDYIAPDGGMLFVFPDAQRREFVMRDCLVPIDIAFLSGSGRVVAMHEMEVEPPQRPDESDAAYESRLERYGSGHRSQFVVEVAGGRLEEVGLKVGDRVEFDARRLKRRAR